MLRPFFDIFFKITRFLIGLFPDMFENTGFWVNTSVPNWIKMLLNFIPLNFFGYLLASVVFYSTLQYSWAVIEWLYKKIPGVD